MNNPVQVGTWSTSVSAVEVPEPATWVFSGFGMAGAALRRRRKVAAA